MTGMSIRVMEVAPEPDVRRIPYIFKNNLPAIEGRIPDLSTGAMEGFRTLFFPWSGEVLHQKIAFY